MSKQITFEYDGAKYTLEFTRKTVQLMQQNGFSADMVTDKPAVGIPMLFRGAFMVNHKNLKPGLADKIYESIKDREKLIPMLLVMYNEPIMEMIEDPEDTEKNVNWGANFEI